jgi:hypothetical protein
MLFARSIVGVVLVCSAHLRTRVFLARRRRTISIDFDAAAIVGGVLVVANGCETSCRSK